jgi:hypothetical protein
VISIERVTNGAYRLTNSVSTLDEVLVEHVATGLSWRVSRALLDEDTGDPDTVLDVLDRQVRVTVNLT